MIRKLRYKFIAVTMLCIGALFLLILLVINVFMTVSSRNRGYEMLRRFTDEIEAPNVPPENAVPAPPPPNALRSRRHADQYQPSRLRTEKFDIFAYLTNF